MSRIPLTRSRRWWLGLQQATTVLLHGRPRARPAPPTLKTPHALPPLAPV